MKRITPLFLALTTFLPARSQYIMPFKNGDRIAFVGNSITHGGRYHSYIWLYYMTHFPDRQLEFFNCGVGGDMAGGMGQRLRTDVFSRKPTAIYLTFGMNDSGYQDYLQENASELAGKSAARSYRDFLHIEQQLIQYSGASKVLVSSSPYDETAKLETVVYPGKNNTIIEIADFQKKAAAKNKWGFIDLVRPITALNLEGQQNDSSFTLVGKDRIHPDADGYLAMAYFILKAQGLAGKPIANVVINAAEKNIKATGNCIISNLTASDKRVQFDYLAKSLPFPMDTALSNWNNKRATDVLEWIPFTKEFNNEALTIEGLLTGQYLLKMNGDSIGQWSDKALANGINLALQTNTPQYRQAEAIRILNEDRWLLELKLRGYYWIQYMFLREKGLLLNDSYSTIQTVMKEATHNIYVAAHLDAYLKGAHKTVRDGWIAEMKALTDKIYTNNKPQKIRVELSPVLL